MTAHSSTLTPAYSNLFTYDECVTVGEEELLAQAASSYQTHLKGDRVASSICKISHYLTLPWRVNIRLLAYTIEPLPGEDKNRVLVGLVKRVGSFVLFIGFLPVGLASLIISLPFYLYSHSAKPIVSMIHNPNATLAGVEAANTDTLRVRTHNLGFIYEFIRVIGDLRPVKTRAEEISSWIENENLNDLPEVMIFQEGFHAEGVEILCNRLKAIYPYVIHSVAPQMMEMQNGSIIVSKYPIKEFSFRPFDNLIGPESWAPKGLVKIRIEKSGKKIDVYGTHFQALLGDKENAARKKEMEDVIGWMNEDQNTSPSEHQFLLGDLNVSKVTAWGEENHLDKDTFNLMTKCFHDAFLNDHNEMSGERTDGDRLFEDGLREPSGSWFRGPMADKGLTLQLKEWNFPRRYQVKDTSVPHHWGKTNWSEHQVADTARFDYILRRKKEVQEGQNDRVEIRRMNIRGSEVQSGSSDHLPVEAMLAI